MPIIEAKGLARTFKSRKRTVEAVRGVDLTVERRGDRRLPRAERRGQDHHPADAHHPAHAHRGHGHAWPAPTCCANPLGVRRRIGYVPQAIGQTMGGTDPACLVGEELVDQAALYRIGAGREAARRGPTR